MRHFTQMCPTESPWRHANNHGITEKQTWSGKRAQHLLGKKGGMDSTFMLDLHLLKCPSDI